MNRFFFQHRSDHSQCNFDRLLSPVLTAEETQGRSHENAWMCFFFKGDYFSTLEGEPNNSVKVREIPGNNNQMRLERAGWMIETPE